MPSPFDPAALARATKEREIDRTAEMVVSLSRSGRLDLAIWLIHDSNRTDAASMKFLAERVEVRVRRAKEKVPTEV